LDNNFLERTYHIFFKQSHHAFKRDDVYKELENDLLKERQGYKTTSRFYKQSTYI